MKASSTTVLQDVEHNDDWTIMEEHSKSQWNLLELLCLLSKTGFCIEKKILNKAVRVS